MACSTPLLLATPCIHFKRVAIALARFHISTAHLCPAHCKLSPLLRSPHTASTSTPAGLLNALAEREAEDEPVVDHFDARKLNKVAGGLLCWELGLL